MNPSDTIELAAVQMSSHDDASHNLDRARALVLDAARKGARLVLLPENLAYMGPEDGKRALAESLDPPEGRIARTLSMAASDAGVYVIAGGIPERNDDPKRPFNTCAVFAPDGSLIARYRKIHLFGVDLPDGTRIDESLANTAGTETVCVDIDGWKVGLSICYDVRFPELYRRLVDQGAELIVVPAAFTLATGKDHWHVLMRARAIESQCYLVASGQWGKHPGARFTYGKSIIVDPWGEVIAQCSEGEGVCVATAQRAYLERVRKNLPALAHRRL
ncbi:MAG: carbon-nitrogen hydrolase family protein [Deltaproteobacteria bacterium]|nr:carbon-nitrogen hydrolase family protein [Deltaproteobacteria bacterium]